MEREDDRRAVLGPSFEDAPRRELHGLVSHVLLQEGDAGDPAMTVTLVDVAPLSRQRPHRHEPQQAYVVVEGEGIMHVDRATRRMRRGDLALVPSGAEHWIENPSAAEALRYVSASAPAFRVTDLYDRGPLGDDR